MTSDLPLSSTELAPSAGSTPKRVTPPSRRWRWPLALLCWGYLIALIAFTYSLRVWGDRDWRFTLLLFTPRWVCLTPIPLLALLSYWKWRRLLWVMGLATFVGLYAMNFHLGVGRFARQMNDRGSLRIIQFNSHYDELQSGRWQQFIKENDPDIVCMEEAEEQLPSGLFAENDWHVAKIGELCIASRYPIDNVRQLPYGIAVRCTIAAPFGPLTFVIVHLTSPHLELRDTIVQTTTGPNDLQANGQLRELESKMLRELASSTEGPIIMAGDFNLMPESPLFQENFATLRDAFDEVGFGFGLTYYNRYTMLRIDHVLSNGSFDAIRCWVGPYFGSPHRPLVADLTLH